MFVDPQGAIGCQRGTLRVAVPVTPYFGQGCGFAHKWIVGGYRALSGDSHHLTVVVVQLLGVVPVVEALAQRQVQKGRFVCPLGGHCNAASEMQVALHLGLLDKKFAYVFQSRGIR